MLSRKLAFSVLFGFLYPLTFVYGKTIALFEHYSKINNYGQVSVYIIGDKAYSVVEVKYPARQAIARERRGQRYAH